MTGKPVLTVAALSLLTLAGCTGRTPSQTQQACAPGEQRACGCGGDAVGFQVCNADGLGFSPCTSCTSTGASSTGSSQAAMSSSSRSSSGPATSSGTTSSSSLPASSSLGPPLEVTITAPATTVFTNGTVTIQLRVSGGSGALAVVDLLVDGQPFATLVPPYSYVLDTTSLTEGTHAVRGRVTQGASVVESSSVGVVVDRTAPTVVSRQPARSADNVYVGEPIRIGFSEPIRAESVSDGAIILVREPGHIEEKTLTLDAQRQTLTVTPTSPPRGQETWSIQVTGAVTDLAGNAVSAAISNWTWSYPAWVLLGEVEGSTFFSFGTPPPMVVSPGGALLLPFCGKSTFRLKVAVFEDGRWSESEEPGMTDCLVGAAMGGSGTLHLVTFRFSGIHPLRYYTWTNGIFSSPIEIGPGSDRVWAPSIALDSLEAPVVAASASTGVLTYRYTSGAWSPMGAPVRDAAAGDMAGPALLGVDPVGTFHVTWPQMLGGGGRLHVAKWDGSAWGPHTGSLYIINRTDYGYWGLFATGTNGDFFLSTVNRYTTEDDVQVLEYSPTRNFDYFDTPNYGFKNYGPGNKIGGSSIATMPDGSPVIVWTEAVGPSTGYGVFGKRHGPDGWVSLPALTGINSFFGTPNVAIGSDGVVHVAATYADGSMGGIVRVYRLNE